MNFSLASIAFGNVAFWLCDTMGCIFLGMAVINMIRYFGEDKSDEGAGEERKGSWSGSPVEN